MPISASAKGIYLFGGSSAASIVPVVGSLGNLVYHAATGDNWQPNYVDLRTGGYFTTPFNSVPRDRTIILVGHVTSRELVYDSDATYKWPATILDAVEMRTTADSLLTWPAGGFLYAAGPVPFFRPASGAPDLTGGSYDKVHTMIAYKDATFNFEPQIFIMGHGADERHLYLGFTFGRKAVWITSTTPYSGAVLASEPTNFGHIGSTAASHTPLLGYAEYPYLSKADALLAATDMVTRLEARGWTGIFHNPITSE